jgi:pimeloyl-ACP methyl ester carboxylesterase
MEFQTMTRSFANPRRGLLAAALLLFCALQTALAGTRSSKPDVVLVHGAFADGSSWSRVIPLLQRKGYHVTSVQLPLTSLADDVLATRRVLERESGDVLLVGHSWGGVVVTEAGNDPKVKAIVYLSALVPDNGESASALLDRFKAPMEGFKPDPAGLVWLDDPAAFHNVMGSDLPMPLARSLAAVQKPIAASSFGDAVSHAAWHDKPTWFLITDADHALQPRVQRLTVDQIHAHAKSLRSSHLSMFSHSQEVADWIDQAARGVSD